MDLHASRNELWCLQISRIQTERGFFVFQTSRPEFHGKLKRGPKINHITPLISNNSIGTAARPVV